ncbi:MAG: MerR family transcriptional regulator [Microbacteriaceae bacterium]|jgi:DNA-binding transcriptional MerR regulator|nr:MerR family transcriptional regulator [Microbacteriaceae bacterium]HEV7957523.1 MerR family transcriptional regulator [Marisediminicola sp.]
MRISELSTASGVTIPTIKFYLRENLLPSGEATSANQARYDESHVKRLTLIRALLEIGGLSVAAARDVIDAVDNADLPLNQVFGIAQRAISGSNLSTNSASAESRARVASVLTERKWHVTDDNPGLAGAAKVLDRFSALGHPELIDLIDDYALAADIVARADLRVVGKQPNVAAMAETVVAGTVLGDAVFAALRRIAQEHVSSEMHPAPHPLSQAPASIPDRRKS